ncbi:hypothetical protein CIB48_g11290 [Xylaria polymorpha]|nr:hypothetical protein CIB48_g11290 [Xylaria polymorpha]
MSAYLSRLFAITGQRARGSSEKRAEFNFIDDGQKFRFSTLVHDSYQSIHSDPKPMEDGRWIRTRWNVGIACDRFTDAIDMDRLGHWGVYITRAIEESTAYKLANRFGGYGETPFYFSWPEFVLIAHEFIFKALSILPEDRPQRRVANPNLWNTARAYHFTQHNCQDFCRLLMNKMNENDWGNPNRIYELFSLSDLAREWRSEDNSWVWRESFGQKHIVSSFLDVRIPEMAKDDSEKLLPMGSQGAEILWRELLGHGREEFCGDKSFTILLSKLNHLPLAIELAAAYVSRNRTPIADYLKLLDIIEIKMRDLKDMNGDVFRMFQKRAGDFKKRYMINISLDAVAVTWLASFGGIHETPGLERLRGAEDIVALLRAYAMLTGSEEEGFDAHCLIHMLMQNWVQCEDHYAKAMAGTIQHLADVLPGVKSNDSDLYRTYIKHADTALFHGQILNTKGRSDVSFAVGQHKMEVWKKSRSVVPQYKLDQAIRHLEYTCQWRRKHSEGNYQDRLESLRALITAYPKGTPNQKGNQASRGNGTPSHR